MSVDWLPRARKLLVTSVFWLALIACVLVLQRHSHEISALSARLGYVGVFAIAGLLAISWGALVAAWKQIVLLYSGTPLSFARSARHLSLLLLGKYLPGGIWGFTARLADTPAEQQIIRLVIAGAFEQWIGLSTLALLASLAWAHFSTGYPLLLLVPGVPYVAVAGWCVLSAVLARFRCWLRWRALQHISLAGVPHGRLVGPAFLTALHQFGQLTMVAVLANAGLVVSWTDACLVASLYGMATTVGILVVVVPGGIVVREGVFVALVVPVLPSDQALAFAALVRLVLAGFDLASAGVASLLGWREEVPRPP